MLTNIVREARKSNKAYGKTELMQLLKKRAETEMMDTDDKFTFRVPSNVLQSMTQTTELIGSRKETSKPLKTTSRLEPRKQVVKIKRMHSPMLPTKSALHVKQSKNHHQSMTEFVNLDDSSGATPTVPIQNPPFTYMGKPLA
jgi:hypothetical protein